MATNYRIRVALLGNGGREDALAWKLKKSPRCSALYTLPGNGGTFTKGTNIDIQVEDFQSIAAFCLEEKIDYLVVGPEAPLVKGIVDYMEKALPALKVIGPQRSAARLEGSKSFAKAFMQRHGIRTPSARIFTRDQLSEALCYVQEIDPPHVLKADGLAAGKGVIISQDTDTSCSWLHKMLGQSYFGAASEQVLIEEHLRGQEVSFFIFCKATSYLLLPEVKDYKKLGAADTGPNTGGMGAISPVPFVDEPLRRRIQEEIIQPTLLALEKEHIFYTGFLFFGLMLCKGLPYLLEYNVRLGDPEAQALLPRLETDLLDIFDAIEDEKLSKVPLQILDQASVTLTMASAGYPGSYESGARITGLADARSDDHLIFHAGTRRRNDHHYYTSGGRVLSIGALDKDLPSALQKAYTLAQNIQWPGCFYRKDIGYDILNKHSSL